MALKEVTALLLIHFEHYPDLSMDKDLDNMRFNKLKELISEHPIEDMIIISEHLKPELQPRLCQLKAQLETMEKGQTSDFPKYDWIELPPVGLTPQQDLIEWIKFEAGKLGCKINNVLATGQNLAGCVWNTKDYSALAWSKKGHLVQIILSMCGDYELPGTGAEKYMKMFSLLYHKIRKSGHIHNIELISDMDSIKYMHEGRRMRKGTQFNG
tara:strand:+ start:206 stop:841 length:636 start_codon:yes stop_codon:yes gene_type:complete